MQKIDIFGILIGVLASHVASSVFGFLFAIACLLVYGSKFLVAFFEYPSSIAITLGLGLVSTSIGGFTAVAVGKKSIVNAVICGVLGLFLSIAILYAMDFKYATNYQWMLALSLLLTIPSAYLGGYLYLANT